MHKQFERKSKVLSFLVFKFHLKLMKKKTTQFWVYLFAMFCDFYLFRLFNDCLIYKLGSPQKLLYTFQVYYIFEVLL